MLLPPSHSLINVAHLDLGDKYTTSDSADRDGNCYYRNLNLCSMAKCRQRSIEVCVCASVLHRESSTEAVSGVRSMYKMCIVDFNG